MASKPGFVKVRLCEDCGEEAGVDPFCDMCGGTIIEVEIEGKNVCSGFVSLSRVRSLACIR